jgi:hypothetical protein
LPPQRHTILGRSPELELLDEYFHGAETLNQKVAILSGLGGIGKTQLALYYLQKNKARYSVIFWVTSDTEKEIVASFQYICQSIMSEIRKLCPAAQDIDIIRRMGIPGVEPVDQDFSSLNVKTLNFIRVLNAYLSYSEQWVMVFDGCDSPETINLRRLFPQNSQCHILVTSRRKDCISYGLQLDISGLDNGAAAELLLQRADFKSIKSLGTSPHKLTLFF